ncbi:sensor histidine kinase [Dyadobacter fanqingshengii]|uniref:Histidine kinase n=1 Tax=Dyadobacter fanqingshengii TaxID=2906443 RepID=A0A9X1PCL2_9BACT|nr:histidine kinase [Dyadobacter fanqingshengii]MCF0040782.1 histidine kinase [Dyadobacter fanqingshengii]USJ37483.1 histidine kinase [Dyadobacter fanqingshengii]
MKSFIASPRYDLPKRLLRHFLFWLAYYLYDGPISSIIEQDPAARIAIAAMAMPVKMIAAYFTLYLLRRIYNEKSDPVRFYSYLVLSIIFFGCLQRTVSYTVIYPHFYPNGTSVPLFYPPKVIIETFGVYSVVAIVVVVHLAKQWYVSQQEKQQLRNEKLEAELKLLKAQIHPHFLFNTLNNLYSLTVTESKKAPEIVYKLSQLLSYMLYDSNKTTVPLQMEIDYIENYITLEKIRYEERLDVSLNVFNNIDHISIAPLLILPFIENSFKHGFINEIGKVWVNIDILTSDNQLIIKVENSKGKIEADAAKSAVGGIGLLNVKKRLELIYKDRYDLHIVDEETYLIILKIKL